MHGEGGGGGLAGDMHGKEVSVQNRRPLKRVVRILLECILVFFKEKVLLIVNHNNPTTHPGYLKGNNATAKKYGGDLQISTIYRELNDITNTTSI